MIKNDPNEAMIRLGMEWAAFPMPVPMQGAKQRVSAGQSYYAGDGRNAAGATVSEVKGVFAGMGGGTGIPLRKDYPMGRAGAKQFKIARKAYSAKLTSKTPKNSTFATESASFTINEKLKNNQTSSTFIINSVEENNVGMSINSLNLNKGKKSGNQILSRL